MMKMKRLRKVDMQTAQLEVERSWTMMRCLPNPAQPTARSMLEAALVETKMPCDALLAILDGSWRCGTSRTGVMLL